MNPGVPTMNTSLQPIRVWDAPVRVFHWLMVASFAGAWLTAESERWRLVHVSLGYTMAGLIVFRLLWGLIGTRHARFADFVRGPRAVLAYLGSLLRGRPEHHAGHNPAGGWMIVALIALAALTALSGWATYAEVGGDWLEELHEGAANAMLALVIVHVAAVVLGSFAHRENLVRAMITGRKLGDPAEDNGSPWRSVAALMLAGVLGFLALQWQQAPDAATATARAAAHERDHDDD